MNITDKIDNYLNEGEDNIQRFIDNLMKQENVKSIKIVFSNEHLSKGPAYYKTERLKGGKNNYPKYIKVGE